MFLVHPTWTSWSLDLFNWPNGNVNHCYSDVEASLLPPAGGYLICWTDSSMDRSLPLSKSRLWWCGRLTGGIYLRDLRWHGPAMLQWLGLLMSLHTCPKYIPLLLYPCITILKQRSLQSWVFDWEKPGESPPIRITGSLACVTVSRLFS